MPNYLSNATVNILQSTYFDDFDETKQYYRILFRPSVSVQARELTQLQTILQNQISRFGDNVFKDGSIVSGVAPLFLANADFVRIDDDFYNQAIILNNASELSSDYIITNSKDSNTAVRAYIYKGIDGFQQTYPDTNLIYLRYYYTGKDGANNDVQKFSNNQPLYIYANQEAIGTLSNNNIIAYVNTYTSNASTNTIGQGYLVSVTDGIIYQKGFFQNVNKQVVVVNAYSSNPGNTQVGFETVESIITEYQDTSLNDNANGSSNYNAPGSHRLKLTPILAVKEKGSAANKKDFFPILEFDNGKITIARNDPVYAALGDKIAKEKFEESGNYTVTPHSVETRAHPSDSTLFTYNISSGISYIKGYRLELIGEKVAESNRSNTTNISQNKTLSINYGPFVYCKEVLGAMAFDKLAEVALYDTAFTAISDREGLSGGTSGNIVGYANIKSVVYYSGIKGTSDCQYYVYLSNIRMLTGKSFNKDVKSIYYANGAGYTKFKADLVLESSVAVLYDSTLTSLIYDTGLKAVKSLTPSGGVRDTSFYYRKTTSSSLYPNGVVSFTLTGGLGAAGTEQIYSTDYRDYNIVLAANAYSANVAGTITANTALANSTAANIVGVSTTFEASLKVGDTIRLSNTGGTAALFKVATIYSNTLMSVTPNVTVNAVSNTYQRYFQDGHIFNLTSGMLTITPATNTFIVATGITIDSGSGGTVYAQYPVVKSPAVQAAKAINKNVLVKIDCSNNINTTTGPWCLGFPDVIKINAIYTGTSYANTGLNRKSWFKFDTGQTDEEYNLGSISILPTYKSNITSSSKILVDIDVLVANTASGIGYFSIDSYPISTDGITSNSTTITVADIPRFISTKSNYNYDLRNCIDFRPIKSNTAAIIATTNPANTLITVNPPIANANTWNIDATYKQYLPEIDSTFIADYEYYLARRDLLVLGKNGDFSVVEGVPNLNPKKPLNASEASTIAETYVPPFPSLTMKEIEVSGRLDLGTTITLKSNRRYTMRDIGILEDRINRLEYYTVLSTLEKQAKDISIPSATGNDRFKNGIFADPFNSHALGNLGSPEYKISIDPNASVARPYYKNHFVDFQYNASNSSVVVQKGPYVMLPYVHEQFAQNPYATKVRVCTEKYWTWNGSLMIAPAVDIFTDETRAAAINNVVDLSSPLQKLVVDAFGGQIYARQSAAPAAIENESQATTDNSSTYFNDVVTARTTSSRISTFSVQTASVQRNTSDAVINVSQLDYIRSQDVAFYSKNMKPNTKLHVFIDSVNVDQYVTPGVVSIEIKDFTYDKKANQVITGTAAKGTALVANSSGCVAGILTIPPAQFRAGDRTIMVCDVDDLVIGKSAILTKSQAIYHASGLSVTKQATTLTTINPEIFVPQGPPTPISPDTGGDDSVQPVIPTPYYTEEYRDNGGGGKDGDPIAQSFMLNVPDSSAGQFITKIDLYFKAKSNIKGIKVFLTTMSNGFPNYSQILGSTSLEPSQVNISDDASLPTTFEFDHPIYISAGTDYAFSVEPEAHDPEYLIWCSEVGFQNVGTNKEQVFRQPYDGVLFVSANRATWTAYDSEDIKFNLHRARFTAGSGSLVLNNENDDYFTLDGVVKANTRSIQVGDVVYTANSTKIANTTTGAPFGIVQDYDETNGFLTIDSSTGGFSSTVGSNMIQIHRISPYTNTSLTAGNAASANLLTSSIIAYANIAIIVNDAYHTITPKFSTLIPQNTKLEFSYKGTDSSYNYDSSWNSLTNEGMNEIFDKERIVMSRSNEITYNSSKKSTFIKIDFSSDDSFLSPVIDLRRKSSYFIENIINNDLTNEYFTYGNALSKYVSKKIVLADGQDAEDLRVTITAFRPINSDITVYAKIASADDSETFENKLWTKLQYLNASDVLYSSQNKLDDYIEYDFGFENGTATIQSFNANTSVNTSDEFITFTNNSFVNNQIVTYYTSVGNTVISSLSNNQNYFVVGANSTALSLSASQGGSACNLTASSTLEIGHYIKGYVAPYPRTAYLNPDSTPSPYIVEYYNNNNSNMQSFKYFAIKIVLTSSDRINYPRLNDVRAIALQK